ncbi:hypothetical protein ABFY48_01865 [Lysinibacillus pakistanensis]|uniref:hypothetical protein n=1 Tax=Lysinibacillus pakistanensis TaxID=759811 RepID=UPI003D285167
MKILRTTHIHLNAIQTVNLPFNPEILNIKLDGDLVKVTYIEDKSQDGFSSFDFRIYSPNREIDFDSTMYSYIGLIEHKDIDYHVFYKNVGQLQDSR